jgi:hypothetical protein
VVDDEQGGRPARGGLIAAVVVGIAAAIGVGTAASGSGETPAPPSPATSSPTSAPSTRAMPSSAPPTVEPAEPPGPPVIERATAADLEWTRSGGFRTCSGLVINVRVRTSGEVTRVLALLLRVSGGPTTRLNLSGSDGLWSGTSLELNAPSTWRVQVVALGPGGRAEKRAEITAPDGDRTTLRHVCES